MVLPGAAVFQGIYDELRKQRMAKKFVNLLGCFIPARNPGMPDKSCYTEGLNPIGDNDD